MSFPARSYAGDSSPVLESIVGKWDVDVLCIQHWCRCLTVHAAYTLFAIVRAGESQYSDDDRCDEPVERDHSKLYGRVCRRRRIATLSYAILLMGTGIPSSQYGRLRARVWSFGPAAGDQSVQLHRNREYGWHYSKWRREPRRSDRIAHRELDAKLPFTGQTTALILVVSNLAFHKHQRPCRPATSTFSEWHRRAERPGGRLLIVDVRGTRHHHVPELGHEWG